MFFPSSGWKSRDSVPKLVDEYMAGDLMVDEFVTFTMPLDSINTAFDYMHHGKRFVDFRQISQNIVIIS